MKTSKHLLIHRPVGSEGHLEAAHGPVARLAAQAPTGQGRKAKPASITSKTARGAAPKASAAMGSGGQRVGVWDLGAWVGKLPAIVRLLDEAQDAFDFSEVRATVPPGIVSRRGRVKEWLAEFEVRPPKGLEDELADNLITTDCYELIEAVRNDLGLDYLAVLTPSMIAGKSGKTLFWNHFTDYVKRVVFISASDLRAFAIKGKMPYEALMMSLLVSAVLAARFPRLDSHKDTGCLFDFNEDRWSLTESTKNLTIDPRCLKLVDVRYRPHAVALVNLIRRVARKEVLL